MKYFIILLLIIDYEFPKPNKNSDGMTLFLNATITIQPDWKD